MANKWLASSAVFVLLLSNPVFHRQAVAQGLPPWASCLMDCGVKVIRCVMGCLIDPLCYTNCGMGNLRCITLCNENAAAKGQIPPVFKPVTRREGVAGNEMGTLEAVANMIPSSSIDKNGIKDSLVAMVKTVAPADTGEKGVTGAFEAMANITSSAGTTENGVRGSLNFFQDSNDNTTHIKGRIVGLSPAIHDLSIHSVRSCSSTGPRSDALNKIHGGPWDENHHSLDLGNIVAGPDGIAEVSIKAETIQLNGVNLILRSAIVVHADTNDLGRGEHEESKITRNLGAAVGCGIIEIEPSI